MALDHCRGLVLGSIESRTNSRASCIFSLAFPSVFLSFPFVKYSRLNSPSPDVKGRTRPGNRTQNSRNRQHDFGLIAYVSLSLGSFVHFTSKQTREFYKLVAPNASLSLQYFSVSCEKERKINNYTCIYLKRLRSTVFQY